MTAPAEPRQDKAPVTVRRATPADIDLLVVLRLAMQRDIAGGANTSDDTAVAAGTQAYLEDALAGGDCVALIAEADGHTVGTGWLVLIRKPPHPGNLRGLEGYFLNMYTPPEWRRKGIARRIVDELVAVARSEGAGTVSLRATDQGRAVYEQAEFTADPRYMRRKL